MRDELLSRRKHPRSVACAWPEAVRVRQVRIHVLRALDAVENQGNLAVGRNSITINHHGRRPTLALKRSSARCSDSGRWRKLRDLSDRDRPRGEVNASALSITQRHESPEHPTAPGARRFATDRAAYGWCTPGERRQGYGDNRKQADTTHNRDVQQTSSASLECGADGVERFALAWCDALRRLGYRLSDIADQLLVGR
jgi:hypothetical protein